MTGIIRWLVRATEFSHRLLYVSAHVIATGRLVPSAISFILASVCLANTQADRGPRLLLCAFPIMLVTMASFMMNDLWDRKKDVRAGRDRPLSRGLIGPRSVAVGLCATVLLAAWITWAFCPERAFYVLLSTLALAILYSPTATTLPLAKNLFAAILCCSPIVFANAVAGRPLFSASLGAIALFIAGRELLLDVMDLEGDVAAGQRTIAFYLRIRSSVRVAWLAMFLGVVVMILLPAAPTARLLQAAAGASLLWAIRPGLDTPLACRRLRLTMILGAIGAGLR